MAKSKTTKDQPPTTEVHEVRVTRARVRAGTAPPPLSPVRCPNRINKGRRASKVTTPKPKTTSNAKKTKKANQEKVTRAKRNAVAASKPISVSSLSPRPSPNAEATVPSAKENALKPSDRVNATGDKGAADSNKGRAVDGAKVAVSLKPAQSKAAGVVGAVAAVPVAGHLSTSTGRNQVAITNNTKVLPNGSTSRATGNPKPIQPRTDASGQSNRHGITGLASQANTTKAQKPQRTPHHPSRQLIRFPTPSSGGRASDDPPSPLPPSSPLASPSPRPDAQQQLRQTVLAPTWTYLDAVAGALDESVEELRETAAEAARELRELMWTATLLRLEAEKEARETQKMLDTVARVAGPEFMQHLETWLEDGAPDGEAAVIDPFLGVGGEKEESLNYTKSREVERDGHVMEPRKVDKGKGKEVVRPGTQPQPPSLKVPMNERPRATRPLKRARDEYKATDAEFNDDDTRVAIKNALGPAAGTSGQAGSDTDSLADESLINETLWSDDGDGDASTMRRAKKARRHLSHAQHSERDLPSAAPESAITVVGHPHATNSTAVGVQVADDPPAGAQVAQNLLAGVLAAAVQPFDARTRPGGLPSASRPASPCVQEDFAIEYGFPQTQAEGSTGHLDDEEQNELSVAGAELGSDRTPSEIGSAVTVVGSAA